MKIFIDPGHGGGDPGACGSISQEKNNVFKTALYLEDELKRQGIQTKISRDNGLTVPILNDRIKSSNTWGSDLVISIHNNSWDDNSVVGTETFVYKFGGNAEKLAKIVQSEIIKAVPLSNRSVKEGNFAIVRDTKAPAILVELGFISNPTEEKKLASSEYQKKWAQAICKGICKYSNINYKEDKIVIDTKEQAIKLLADKRIINNPDHWTKACEVVSYLDTLFINVANAFND